ncbi:hypothetical protein PTKIN_Ptkin06aG0114200 [Pterospermum kingtungense]
MHKLEKNHQEADRILGNIVNEHKESRARAKGTSEESDEDLVDVLLRLQEHGEFSLTDCNIKAVILDGSCKVALGSNRSDNIVIALPSEMEIIPPRKSDKIKIMGGSLRGFTGKVIDVDAMDGI